MATSEGTCSYFERFKNQPARNWAALGWNVSPVGFGSYRVAQNIPGHREALEKALLSGINLIDTSTNYTDGASERLIGETLNRLIEQESLKRSEIVVVSKVGYVQGENLRLAKKREAEGEPFPEMTQFSPDCWHCISPEFLQDQITRSLGRLKLNQIDVLLLHNPEYFLKAGGDAEEYYTRIKRAFEYLETEVQKGRIQAYGVSSNTFVDPKESPEFTSLEVIWELAEQISPSNHFKVIQFPFNLYEPGAVFENNNAGKSVTEFAQLRGLTTLINRPLNAFYGNRLIRLAGSRANPSSGDLSPEDRLTRALRESIDIESVYPSSGPLPKDRIAWGHLLSNHLTPAPDLEHWRQALDWQIKPTMEDVASHLAKNPNFHHWAKLYRDASLELFAAFTAYVEDRAQLSAQRVMDSLDQACTPLKSSPTLSQKVVRAYLSIPGIDCVLVGMRRESYVTDILEMVTRFEPLTPEQALDAMDAAIDASTEGTPSS